MSKQRIIMMSGLPGSGKSTLVKKLRNEHNLVVICPDNFRLMLTGQPFHQDSEETVWANIKLTAKVLLNDGYSLLLDECSISKFARSQWMKIANHFNVNVECHVVTTPMKICKNRNSKRPNPVPDYVIERMNSSYQEPELSEGFVAVYFYNENLEIEDKDVCNSYEVSNSDLLSECMELLMECQMEAFNLTSRIDDPSDLDHEHALAMLRSVWSAMNKQYGKISETLEGKMRNE